MHTNGREKRIPTADEHRFTQIGKAGTSKAFNKLRSLAPSASQARQRSTSVAASPPSTAAVPIRVNLCSSAVRLCFAFVRGEKGGTGLGDRGREGGSVSRCRGSVVG